VRSDPAYASKWGCDRVGLIMDFPRTLGIIMDGNRRFAKERGLLIKDGHEAGAKKLQEVLEWLKNTKVENIICYAFSTENWKREESEVANLMDILEKVLRDTKLIESGYKISIIGEKEKLARSLQTAISLAEEATGKYEKNLFIALSYGGRAELVRACNNLIQKNKKIVSEADIQNELYTKNIPDPDLIIRTGGRHSLSNFLIWQAAYAEFYVTDTLWPAFTQEEFFALFERFSTATRKMGA
jgi:undecaprenyl diphosphate synthase